jgi:hypothetical protein
LGGRQPVDWRGWVTIAVWMTVWLASIPFVNSPDHPFLSLGFFFGWLAVWIAVSEWKGEP